MSLRRRIFMFFASLKLAVITILTLSSVLAWGTFAESWYGIRGAKILVYGTWWFAGVLFMLGLNVTCAALSRYPWKRSQTGFVITHLGIITLLFGSVMTQRWGVDGSLPITEQTESSEVVLSESVLTIKEEDSDLKMVIPVPLSHLMKEKDLLRIRLNDNYSLVMDAYMPRARFSRTLRDSPIKKMGYPAIRVEIYNDNFNIEKKLVDRNPGVGAEVSLGPASVNFRKLWSQKDLKEFLKKNERKNKKEILDRGMIVAEFRGREFRIPIRPGYRTKRMLGNAEAEIQITKFYSYAVVKGKELINKSDEMLNPAVQLKVSAGPDRYEIHTIFQNFPEFPTKHEKKSKGNPFNVKFALRVKQQDNTQMGIVGRSRGKLLLAQGPDNKLYHKVLSKEGAVNSVGPIEVDQIQETGWMNLKFRITEWFPYSVESFEPKYVETIAGTDGNFLSAARIQVRKNAEPRSTASSHGDPVWIMEGSRRSFSLDGKRFIVNFGKEELSLPFKIFLEDFRIGHNPGTKKAASYESTVRVNDPGSVDSGDHIISMNEPLVYAGYTFYQASYQLQDGQPPISIFSVNRDPGRWVKYFGSLIMCLGILLMFYMNPHYFDKVGFGFLRRKP